MNKNQHPQNKRAPYNRIVNMYRDVESCMGFSMSGAYLRYPTLPVPLVAWQQQCVVLMSQQHLKPSGSHPMLATIFWIIDTCTMRCSLFYYHTSTSQENVGSNMFQSAMAMVAGCWLYHPHQRETQGSDLLLLMLMRVIHGYPSISHL